MTAACYLVELVGGPLDGDRIAVDGVCSCCGSELTAGTILETRRGYVWFAYRVDRLEGSRGSAVFDHADELTLDTHFPCVTPARIIRLEEALGGDAA